MDFEDTNSQTSFESVSAVATVTPAQRARFLRLIYSHVSVAILLFAGLSYWLSQSGIGELFARIAFATTWGWLGIIILFGFAGVLAQKWSASKTSRFVQYLGLLSYVVIEALLFTPLLYYVQDIPGVINLSALLTLFLAGGLTLVAFITGTDFSFLRGVVALGFFVALGVLLATFVFGPVSGAFAIGFFGIMVFIAGCAVLYETSTALRYYKPDEYVAASLRIFAAIAYLFWNVIQFVLSILGRD